MCATKKTGRATVPPASPTFTRIAAALRRDGGIDDPSQGVRRAFGAEALKVNGKIFAMPVKGRVVLKLPKERVTSLIAAKRGEYFDPGHGRVMKEWVSLVEHDDALTLAREARAFVAAGKRRP
jgi:hypothetical protein